MTEMVCVSPAGRITPGCTGIYTAEQEESWRRVVGFVHGQTRAKIGIQLGHSGPQGLDPADVGGDGRPAAGRQLGGLRAFGYPLPGGQPDAARADRAELDEIRGQFVAAAQAAARAGFDLLELHCAHGYLLSSFLSPLTNRRTDRYGGSLAARLRYPLEVFDAIRAVWPEERPMTVRISATDWHPDGLDIEDTVEIARAFAEHGAAGIDVSTGQVVSDEKPAFGRSYQTPYADRIRNEIGTKYGVAVIAVGAISSYDDVNSIILAGPGRPVRPRPDPPVRPAVDPARRRRAGIRRPGCGLAGAVRRGEPAARGRAYGRAAAPAGADPGRDAAHRARPLAPGARCGGRRP